LKSLRVPINHPPLKNHAALIIHAQLKSLAEETSHVPLRNHAVAITHAQLRAKLKSLLKKSRNL
jgi:hypothetical protein